ncbi:hypothetical protein [Paenibacillus barengoltzii]|uniref:hypothetical protein n=1 Tax=Paenibacillus barengoltzii TaxID=343517 RepID=UPI000FDBD507|nr:hypothetical protein [Paenibacillus barengoltzii]
MAKAIVKLIDGLPLKNQDANIELTFDEQFLLIAETRPQGFKMVTDNLFKIPLENVIDTLLTTEKEVVEKNKSVIGRGVVGGLVFGPAGLFLGGLSGIGKKSKVEKSKIYIVSYVGSDKEVKNITFGMNKMMVGVTEKFDKAFSKHHKLVPKSPDVQRLFSSDGTRETIL